MMNELLTITYIDGTEESFHRKRYSNSQNIPHMLCNPDDGPFLSFCYLDSDGKEHTVNIRKSLINRIVISSS